MNPQELAVVVAERLSKQFPNAETELHYHSPWELLVAVVLSAQCTDARVNKITPALFQAFPSPKIMAEATEKDIFHYIQSISFPNNKSKNLLQTAKILTETYNQTLPNTREALEKLPGVGRKTANVLLSVLFNQPTFAVDTHVFRVSHRVGLVLEGNTPESVEKQLVTLFSPEQIPLAHHWLILHGRYTCKSRKPLCSICCLADVCYFYQAELSGQAVEDKKISKKKMKSNERK